MELVVDSNILISTLIKKGKARELFFDNQFKLYAPELLINEIHKHFDTLEIKTGLQKNALKKIINIATSRIIFVDYQEFDKFIEEAKLICPDENDIEFFALALSKDIDIWSNDKALKRQNKLKIYNTHELIEITTNLK
jgi:predicted nucleic acid-binding protein